LEEIIQIHLISTKMNSLKMRMTNILLDSLFENKTYYGKNKDDKRR
jgi:hypothetical protein